MSTCEQCGENTQTPWHAAVCERLAGARLMREIEAYLAFYAILDLQEVLPPR